MRTALLIASVALASQAAASELVYYPLNPSFGGNALNGSVLLNSALATNKHTDPAADAYGIEDKTPAQLLNETIERTVINRMATAASGQIMDGNGNFVPGTLETSNFTITVAVSPTNPNNLTITTLDKLTGATTVFNVSNQG
ncbi:curli assembly protein CsgF [Pollutimonas nitritireducens]|uniref:Curli production assembly/transport component CsgF n=1 Tax=Pollutimonas nitritireducens TaxID=2045209 RepID=A0A2N4UCA6_9BURK|nr:curli assembly protein CsgF [Pollutimonas nitritireducens]